ncbi:MAG: type II toxin-antitoxin system HicA family toxin [Methylobacter sp.]
MGHLPVLKPREVVALLEALGFNELRQRGSHKQFHHPDGRLQQSHFTLDVMCHRFCFGKLPKILGYRSMSFLRSKPNKMLKLRLISTNFKSTNQV